METSTTPTIEARRSPRRWPRDGNERREFDSKSRIYFWPTGESILDNLTNRRSRPYELYRELIPQVFDQLGLQFTPALKARWSQRAGCSCPCSPGFILPRRLVDADGRPFDIHVDIS
jgi:hypothetical protein